MRRGGQLGSRNPPALDLTDEVDPLRKLRSWHACVGVARSVPAIIRLVAHGLAPRQTRLDCSECDRRGQTAPPGESMMSVRVVDVPEGTKPIASSIRPH